jgi:hypothetical protein
MTRRSIDEGRFPMKRILATAVAVLSLSAFAADPAPAAAPAATPAPAAAPAAGHAEGTAATTETKTTETKTTKKATAKKGAAKTEKAAETAPKAE